MSNNRNQNNMNIIDSYSVYIAKYIDSLSLWKKELQMILITLYISLSSIITLVDHIINFHTTYPMKLVDILVFTAMFVLLFVTGGFIYGCFKKDRNLLFLTPAIPNLLLIYVFFPNFHAFFIPLNAFFKNIGLEHSLFSRILNNLGSFTMIRVIYFVPIMLYCRFLFNNYTDEFVENLQEVIEIEKKEAEDAQKASEEAKKVYEEKLKRLEEKEKAEKMKNENISETESDIETEETKKDI